MDSQSGNADGRRRLLADRDARRGRCCHSPVYRASLPSFALDAAQRAAEDQPTYSCRRQCSHLLRALSAAPRARPPRGEAQRVASSAAAWEARRMCARRALLRAGPRARGGGQCHNHVTLVQPKRTCASSARWTGTKTTRKRASAGGEGLSLGEGRWPSRSHEWLVRGRASVRLSLQAAARLG
jgi:hypothetical protein